nr:hypothetical protein [Calditrichia bacterium]
MITCQKCHTPNDGDLLVCRKCKSFLGFDKIPDQKELEEEFDKLFSRKKAGQSSAPESFETREFTTQPIELPPFQTEIEADFPPDEETTVEQDALPEDPLAFDEPGLVPDSEISEAETLSEDPLEYPEEDLTLDLDESDQDDTAYEVDDDLAADWLDQIAPQEVEESTWDAPEAPAESWSEDAEPAAEVETHWEETEDDAVTAPLSQADLAPETAEDLPQRQENPLPEPEESLEHPWEEQSSPEQIEKIVEADFRRPSGPENYRDEELPEADPVAGKETLTATPEESAGERQLEKIAPTIDA